MPWKECSVTEERLRFVARLLEGEGMSEVCRDFGISRKTGYKIFNRYRDQGLDALADRSRRPVRYANQLPDQIERLIVDLKRDKPHWGARKIRELLVRKLAGDVRLPAKSTVHAVLDRHGLVKRARATAQPRQRHAVVGRGGSQRAVVRRLQGRVQARQWPLLLPADGLRPCFALSAAVRGPRINAAKPRSSRRFSGCSATAACPPPSEATTACRSPVPTASTISPRLSVWWLRLGIAIERIKPGHPQQNGRHERMHLTLKKEATRPPGLNCSAAASQVRCLRARVQRRTPARGARHAMPGRTLHRLTTTL